MTDYWKLINEERITQALESGLITEELAVILKEAGMKQGTMTDFVTKDMVNSPDHYKNNPLGIECIKAIEASMSPEEFKGYLKGNAMKYIWRYTYKGKPKEDLQKAEYYLKALIERV